MTLYESYLSYTHFNWGFLQYDSNSQCRLHTASGLQAPGRPLREGLPGILAKTPTPTTETNIMHDEVNEKQNHKTQLRLDRNK